MYGSSNLPRLVQWSSNYCIAEVFIIQEAVECCRHEQNLLFQSRTLLTTIFLLLLALVYFDVTDIILYYLYICILPIFF